MQGIVLSVWLLALSQDAATLIERLRSDRPQDREEASRALRELGPGARPELEKAAKSPDPELAGRAQEILRWIDLRRSVSARLRETVPGIVERVAARGDHEWVEIFREIRKNRPTRRTLRELTREDWTTLASGALLAGTPPEQVEICAAVGELNLKECVADLLGLLKAKDHRAREAALGALEDMEVVQAVPAILPLLKDSWPGLRYHAATVLGKFGNREGIPVLARLLTEPRFEDGYAGRWSLIEVDARELVPELLKILTDRQNQEARDWLAEMLAGLARASEIPDLLRLLEQDDRLVSPQAALALRRLDPPTESLSLDRIFQTKSVGLRALLSLSPEARWWKAASPRVAELLQSKDPQILVAAIPVVSNLGLPSALPDLLRFASFSDSGVRRAAIAALGRLEGEAVRTELAKHVEDPDIFVQAETLQALARVGAKEEAPAILGRLKDPEPFVRGHAAMALADLGIRSAADPLRTLLADPNPYPAADALRALVQLFGRAALPDLEKALAGKDSPIRSQAAILLAELGASEWRTNLLPLLKDKETLTRDLGISCVAALGADPGLMGFARALLEHAEPLQRVSGCRALGRWGDRAAIPQLRALLQDDHLSVHLEAARALCRLGSREGAEPLLRESGFSRAVSLTELNALRRPETWERLSRLRPLLEGEGTPEEILIGCARAAGVTLEGKPRRTHGWSYVSSSPGTCWGRTPHELLPLLELGLGGERDLVLEPYRFRILKREDSLRFWSGWLRGN